MTNALQCLRGRLRGAEGVSDDELQAILDDLDARARLRQKERQLDSAEEALFGAAEDVQRELQIAGIVEKRNAALNAVVSARIDRQIAEFTDPVIGMEALLSGVNLPGRAGKASIDARSRSLELRLNAGMVAELERAKLLPFVTRAKRGRIKGMIDGEGVLDREIAQELWEMDRTGGRPGVSGSTEARRIAEIVHRYQEMGRRLQNQAGAFIPKLPGYIVRQSHDPSRLRRAAGWRAKTGHYEAWRDFIEPKLDLEATIGTADPEMFLHGVYDALISGVHMKSEGVRSSGGFVGPANLAKKVSAERVLHFATADDWYDYHRRFGDGNLMEAVAAGLRNAAENTAIMQGLGTNPRAMFDRKMRELRERYRGDPAVSDRLRGNRLENQFREIDGTTRSPVNVGLAKIGHNIRAWNVISKLGGATVSSITDLPHQAAELRHQGANLATMADGYVRGALNAVPGGRQRQEAAELLLIGLEGRIGNIAARVSSNDDMSGVLSKLVRTFMRLNLLQWWTDSHKAGFAHIMSRRLAQVSDLAFDALDPDMRRMLTDYDIGAREWDFYRQHAMVEQPDGLKMASPMAAREAPEDAIAAVAADDLAELGRRSVDPGEVMARRRASIIQRWRDELELRLETYIADRVDHAVPTPGARERAILNRGTRPGTVEGEVIRMLAQFKQFPVTVITKAWGRDIYGRGKADFVGMAHLLVASWLFGFMAMTAKDVLKGRSPRDPTDPAAWAAAFVQGGGAGIYGDFFFGEFNRFGGGAIETLAGPAAGQLGDVLRLWAAIREGEGNAANQLFRLTKNNTPFINLFYTRMALDYLVLYQLQEAVAPGSLRRMERAIERENGQQFFLPPSQIVR